ncbi:hypothetical protein STEG23_008977, partial [Scotinomys teguina]
QDFTMWLRSGRHQTHESPVFALLAQEPQNTDEMPGCSGYATSYTKFKESV